MAELAENVISDVTRELALTSDALPQQVRDAHDDYTTAIGDIISTGRQLKTDLDELEAKRDLIPQNGADRLRLEAKNDAGRKYQEADRRAEQSLDRLRDSLLDAALPKLDPKREQLARDELQVALGNAQGPGAAGAAATLATHGSREAVAALFSPFGRTLLASRGVKGPELNRLFDDLRRIAATAAIEHATTPGEILAGRALRKVNALGAARGAAGSYVRRNL
jgi:hypothetical protein